jgi:hypothetical protein
MSASAWLEEWQQRAGKRWWWPLAGGLVLIAGICGLVIARSGSGSTSEPQVTVVANTPDGKPERAAQPALPPATAPAPPEPAPAAAPDAGAAPSATVKLVFRTFPSRPAVVMWGGKRLGIIDRNKPLVVERPRDSGPLDVIVRSTGFIPVHTRAYTFNDSNIDVKLTLLEKKDTIYGYKEPLPPDAGVPFPSEAAEIPE